MLTDQTVRFLLNNLNSIFCTLMLCNTFGLHAMLLHISHKKLVQKANHAFRWALFSYATVLFIYLIMLFIGTFLLCLPLFALPTGYKQFLKFTTTKLNQDGQALLISCGLSLIIPALLGITLLIPYVRRQLAKILPFEAASHLHALGLSFFITSILSCYSIGALSFGLEGMVKLVNLQQPQINWPTDLVMHLIHWPAALLRVTLLLLTIFFSAGWLIRRTKQDCLARLGLKKPSLKQVLIGLTSGTALAIIVTIVGILGGPNFFNYNDPNIPSLQKNLILQHFSLTLGEVIVAGLIEEPIFRGLLQPRFGIPLTASLFALTHIQYGTSISLLIIFILGIIWGKLREKYNTTLTVISHCSYN
ncbi:MAG: hypothetical protein RLZ12_565, partial [Bacillota bacterium]